MSEPDVGMLNRWRRMSQTARGLSFIAVGTVLLVVGIITSHTLSPSRSSTNVYASGAGPAAPSTTTSTTSSYGFVSTTSTNAASTVRLSTTTSQPIITTTTQLIADPSNLNSGWVARLGSSQPGVPREVSDITNLLTQVRSRYPNAAVYLTDALGGRSTLRSGYLVLLIGSYPDRSGAAAVCAQLPSSMKPYGCEVDHIS